MMLEPNTILKDNNLRVTTCRDQVLRLFIQAQSALSNADIEDGLSNEFDRVTVYRTLKTFLKKGIIHKVPDDTGNLKYALCTDECSGEQHNHQHVHFKCENCGLTVCLDHVKIPEIKLPEGYYFADSNLLVNGTCDKCNLNSI